MRRLAIALSMLTACGDDSSGSATDTDTGGPDDALFPAIGPLVGEDGRGAFRFGAASAATQIEDQNPNVDWYVWTAPAPEGLGEHTFVGDASRGYSMALADVELLAGVGLDSYRFSIEWARIEPQRDVIDEAAIAHYDAFIDALVERGIRPMITVHHFSNPIWLDDPRDPDCVDGPSDANLCGWDHPEGGPLSAEELGEHAMLLAERFGDRVDEWATLNEPINYMLAAYGIGLFPPGRNGVLEDFAGIFVPTVRNYVAGHVAAYRALQAADTIDADEDGVLAAVGLTMGVAQWVPTRNNELSDDPDDIGARDRVAELYHHLFVRAVVEGGFDNDIDGTLEESRPEWAATLDWLGVQYYFRAGVTSQPGLLPGVRATPCFGDFDVGSCAPPLDPTFVVPAMGYEHNPAGLYDALADYGARYPAIPLVVSESGIATESGPRRAAVVVRALEQIERARAEGIDVRGYYHWSIYDNFEWAEGYVPRFGLYRVDYETYARTPTDAVPVLTEIVGARDLPQGLRTAHGGAGPLPPEL